MKDEARDYLERAIELLTGGTGMNPYISTDEYKMALKLMTKVLLAEGIATRRPKRIRA